jgi:hypothetical protein
VRGSSPIGLTGAFYAPRVDDPNSEIGELERQIVEARRKDLGHRRRVVLNALAKLPPDGGSFAELYNEFLPTRRAQRQVQAIEAIARRLDREIALIDQSRILSEPFPDVFEDVMAAVATRQGLEKREYYAAVLANALKADAPGYDRQERMIGLLAVMRLSHLRLLAIVVRDLESQQHTGSRRRTGVHIKLDEDADLDLIQRDWRDMVAWDLLKDRPAADPDNPARDLGNRGIPVSTYFGDPPQSHLSVSITPFGEEFALYVGAGEKGERAGELIPMPGTNRGAQPRTRHAV